MGMTAHPKRGKREHTGSFWATVSYPIARFPKLRDDPANIEWVRRDVNGMKGDSTPDEFLALIYRILEYRSRRAVPSGANVGGCTERCLRSTALEGWVACHDSLSAPNCR